MSSSPSAATTFPKILNVDEISDSLERALETYAATSLVHTAPVLDRSSTVHDKTAQRIVFHVKNVIPCADMAMFVNTIASHLGRYVVNVPVTETATNSIKVIVQNGILQTIQLQQEQLEKLQMKPKRSCCKMLCRCTAYSLLSVVILIVSVALFSYFTGFSRKYAPVYHEHEF
jgi:hypothetical protein